jgi:ATP/maltotriose-dependent transcriptional regulator MalT
VDLIRGDTAPAAILPRPRGAEVEVTPAWTGRPRLVDRHVDAGDVDVIVVSAPAGMGKSVLAQQWAADDLRPHATVRIAPWYDDPAALAGELLEALEPLGAHALALTHADETDQIGVAIEAACRFGLAPEYMLDRGRTGPWRLSRIDPPSLAARLLQ